MTERKPLHLSDEELLLWQSGEVPAAEREWAGAHLESCASCRERLRETDAVLGELREVSRRGDLDRFSTLLASADRRRHPLGLVWRPVLATAPVAAALIGLLVWNGSVPAVSATELVGRAVREEMEHPRAAARFRLRDADGECALPARSYRAGAVEPSCERMRSRLVSANWDWEHPLSARGFERWRRSLVERHDTVTEQHNSVKLRTTTAWGAVRAATIEMRNSDFHAIATRLEFDGAAQIEIAEDSTAEVVATAPVELPPAPEPPPIRLSEPDVPSWLDTAEVSARVALHRIHADSGFETVIRREPSGLEVFGLVRDAARQEEVGTVLAGIPRLRVRIKTYAEFENGDDAWFPRGEQGNTLPPLAANWLKSSYPSMEESARFVNRVNETATALLGEAAVLEDLGGRPALTPVVRDHQERMAFLLGTLADDLAPLAGPLGGVRAVGLEQARVLQSAVTRCLSASRAEAGSLEEEIARVRAVYHSLP